MTDVHVDPGLTPSLLGLCVGDLVEVRSVEEIISTLDDRGELDNLPFMPEMLAFAGRRMRVHKVAHKVCDTISRSGMRKLSGAVYLSGARCDGSAHGGCQTACQLIWREQWLRRVAEHEAPAVPVGAGGRVLLPLLTANTRREPGPDGSERFSCQATELNRAAPVCLPVLQLGQYVQDFRSGNAGVAWIARAFLVGVFNRLQALSKQALPPALQFRHGKRWRFLEGRARGGTPSERLDLRPGDLVRIKSEEAILETLDENLLNRGMGFDEEMSRFCGRTARVSGRVERCIDERTGQMLTMKYPCIVLDGLVCEGAFNAVCPRQFVPFWREIWLERI